MVSFSSNNPERFKQEDTALDRSSSAGKAELSNAIDFLSLSFEPIIAWREDGGITSWSRGAEQLYGYSKDEAAGRRVDDLLQSGLVAPSGADSNFVAEITYTAKDGRKVIVERRRQALEIEGTPSIVETSHDITRRWLTETELQEREREFHSVFDVANVGKTVIDPLTRRFIRVNPAFCEIVGYSEAELSKKTVGELNHPDDLEGDREQFTRLINGDSSVYDLEKRYVRKDGSAVWVHVTGNMIRDAEGRPYRATAVVTDITARRELEDKVRAQFDELENIYRTAPIGLAMISSDLRFLRINEWLAEINGVPAADHVGRRVNEVVPDLSGQAEVFFRQVLETGEPVLDVEIEGETPSRPGVKRTWKESWYPINNLLGTPVAVSIVVEEITERKRAEERLKFLADLNQKLLPLVEPDNIMSATARSLGEFLDVDRCAYAEVINQDTFVITGDYLRGVPSIVGRWPVAAFGAECTRQMLAGEPYIVTDSENDSRIGQNDLPAYHATNIRSVICVPLHKSGKFTAAMAVHQKTVRVWTDEEIELVQLIVNRCWESLERARTIRRLRDSEERMRLATDAADIFSWETDLRDRTVKWSDNAAKVIGCRDEDLPTGEGGGLFFVLEEDQERLKGEIHQLLTRGFETFHLEFRGNEGESERRYWEARGLIIYDADKRPRRVVGVTQNVTYRWLAEEALRSSNERERSARQEAEAANRAKDDFLAVLSHELRTPLHAMKGWVSLLESGGADRNDWAKAAEVIKRNLNAQSSLVDDLLDVSRIISGTLALEKEKVPLVTLIFDAIEDVRRGAEQRGLTLSVDLDQTVGSINADPQRLRQVVNNLLTNAIKFTDAGGRIAVRLERSGDVAVLTVSDSGIGIAADVLPKIFDRFLQADSSTRRKHGGLGLGLAIVKYLVELHGGQITAASRGEGEGTQFRVDLPLGDVPLTAALQTPFMAQADAGARTDPDSILAGTRILVVDDNEDARMVLSIALTRKGSEVVTAESGAEAIAVLSGRKFDLLICDIGMPDMDGHDLLGIVRGQLNLDSGRLPAIALSGFAGSEDRERSLATGFQLHIAKPIDPFEFSGMVRAVIDRASVA